MVPVPKAGPRSLGEIACAVLLRGLLYMDRAGWRGLDAGRIINFCSCFLYYTVMLLLEHSFHSHSFVSPVSAVHTYTLKHIQKQKHNRYLLTLLPTITAYRVCVLGVSYTLQNDQQPDRRFKLLLHRMET